MQDKEYAGNAPSKLMSIYGDYVLDDQEEDEKIHAFFVMYKNK